MTTERALAKELRELEARLAQAKRANFDLEPVFVFYRRLKTLPRAALVERFKSEFGRDAPAAKREWLEEALGRRFQRAYYEKHKGDRPTSVKVNDADFWTTPPALLGDGERDRDEVDLQDPCLRVVAATTNPFARGKSWRVFMTIESSERGLSYEALSRLLQGFLPCPESVARNLTQRSFTAWVRQGITKLVFEDSR